MRARPTPKVAAIIGHTMQSATRILERYGAHTRRLAEAAILGFENASSMQFANRATQACGGSQER